MAKRKHYIPGIYNYCDRWCDRCDFTQACSVFAEEQRISARHLRKGEAADSAEVALKDIAGSFARLRRMLARHVKAQGLDFEEIARQAVAEPPDEDPQEQKLDKHPLVRQAWTFMELCGKVLGRLNGQLETMAQELQEQSAYVSVRKRQVRLGKIHNAIEVLQWDHTLVTAKVRRAISGLMEAGESQGEWATASLDDATGSAYVACKCLTRSTEALRLLYDEFEELRDALIDLLALASKLRKDLEKALPGCLTFVWPPAMTGD